MFIGSFCLSQVGRSLRVRQFLPSAHRTAEVVRLPGCQRLGSKLGRKSSSCQFGRHRLLLFSRPIATESSSPCLRRSDIHEEASVKTGARRSRDYPDIHSASPAIAERHERECGCSHLHQRRCVAPWRTPGCNLSPALDLDVSPLSIIRDYVTHSPGGAVLGYLARARFSSQTVPRFSMAHITRTR